MMVMQRKMKSPSGAVLICSLLAAALMNEPSPLTNALAGSATRAQSSATLSGVTTDTFGARLAGATISLCSVDRVLQISSDVKGQFQFAHVPPGTYQLEVAHQGFKTRRLAAVQLTDRNEPLSVSLEVSDAGDCGSEDLISYAGTSGRKIIGTVLDSGRPVAGAEVDLVSASAARALATVRSNDDGEFLLADLEPGQYSLRVSHPGHRDERTGSFWVARETTTKVQMEMTRQGLLRVCQ
jgi:hypothetical protein